MNPIIEQTRAIVQKLAENDKDSIGGSTLDYAMLAEQVNAETMRQLCRDKDGNITSSTPGLDLAANVIPVLVHNLPALHDLIGDGPATDGRVVLVSSEFVRNKQRQIYTKTPEAREGWVSKALLCAAQRALGLHGSDGAKIVNPDALASAMKEANLPLVGLDQPVSHQLLATAMDIGRDWKDHGAPAGSDDLADRWRDVRETAQAMTGSMPAPEHYAHGRLSVLQLAAQQANMPIEEQISQAALRINKMTEFMSTIGTPQLASLVMKPLLEHEPFDNEMKQKTALAEKLHGFIGEESTLDYRAVLISGLSSNLNFEKNLFIVMDVGTFNMGERFNDQTMFACLLTDKVDENMMSIAIHKGLLSKNDYADVADFITQVQKSSVSEALQFIEPLRYGHFDRENYPDQVSFDRHFGCLALNAMDAGGFVKEWLQSGGYKNHADAEKALSEGLARVVSTLEGEPAPLVRQALERVSQTFPASQEWFATNFPAKPKKGIGPG